MADAPTIVFMGTPQFAVPALRALHAQFGVRAVVTVADKPQGRGLSVRPSAVKEAALDLGIPTILQPVSLKDPVFLEALRALHVDVLCVIAFRILPREVYSMARCGAFNVHASLLPAYRGAAPINHAIICGDAVTGVTSFLLNDVVDTGQIIQQLSFPIDDGITFGELYEALMPLAAQCAVSTTTMLLDGTAVVHDQDNTKASPAPKVYRETSGIDWLRPRRDVRNFIHGLSPIPAAWTMWNSDVVKIYRASLATASVDAGTWSVENGTLLAGCADGALSIDEIQVPGKKRMNTTDYLRGYRGPLNGVFA